MKIEEHLPSGVTKFSLRYEQYYVLLMSIMTCNYWAPSALSMSWNGKINILHRGEASRAC